MKLFIYFLIPILLLSCKSQKPFITDAIEEKLELCYEHRVQQLKALYGDSVDLPIIKNIHSLVENRLLQAGVLNGIAKADYQSLFKNANWSHQKLKLDGTLKKVLYQMEELFASPSGFIQDLGCYDFLSERLKLLKQDDFRFKIYQLLLDEEISGDYMKDDTIIELINTIPDGEFEKVVYRRLIIKALVIRLLENKGF